LSVKPTKRAPNGGSAAPVGALWAEEPNKKERGKDIAKFAMQSQGKKKTKKLAPSGGKIVFGENPEVKPESHLGRELWIERGKKKKDLAVETIEKGAMESKKIKDSTALSEVYFTEKETVWGKKKRRARQSQAASHKKN